MRYLTPPLALLLLLAAPAAARFTPDEIGTTAAIKKRVTGTVADSERRLRKGDTIHQDERIVTAAESEGEFVLEDQTKLAVGPDSTLVLDKFVYDPARKNGAVVIKATKGAFRFISGKSDKSAYRITTPVASIGVRGTTFDGFVDENGEIAVLLVKGEVDVCNRERACRRLKQRGRFFHVRRNGRVVGPMKWDGSFFRGVKFGRAFPFVGRRLRIDRGRHFKRADLMGGRTQRGGRAAGRQTRGGMQRGQQRGGMPRAGGRPFGGPRHGPGPGRGGGPGGGRRH